MIPNNCLYHLKSDVVITRENIANSIPQILSKNIILKGGEPRSPKFKVIQTNN